MLEVPRDKAWGAKQPSDDRPYYDSSRSVANLVLNSGAISAGSKVCWLHDLASADFGAQQLEVLERFGIKDDVSFGSHLRDAHFRSLSIGTLVQTLVRVAAVKYFSPYRVSVYQTEHGGLWKRWRLPNQAELRLRYLAADPAEINDNQREQANLHYIAYVDAVKLETASRFSFTLPSDCLGFKLGRPEQLVPLRMPPYEEFERGVGLLMLVDTRDSQVNQVAVWSRPAFSQGIERAKTLGRMLAERAQGLTAGGFGSVPLPSPASIFSVLLSSVGRKLVSECEEDSSRNRTIELLDVLTLEHSPDQGGHLFHLTVVTQRLQEESRGQECQPKNHLVAAGKDHSSWSAQSNPDRDGRLAFFGEKFAETHEIFATRGPLGQALTEHRGYTSLPLTEWSGQRRS